MARTKISEFSATPANNTDIDSINIAEGCAPSGINDAIRELMAQLKDFQTGAVGDSFNGPIGSSTASTGAFTTLSASGTATLSGLTASTALALDASKNIVSVTNTGTGSNVLATSPTLVTPALGTPSSGTVTNLTGTASININGTVGATTASTGAFTTLAASSTVTLSGGTANGVAYLNGSKVVTSGSALTFDGTTLTSGAASFTTSLTAKTLTSSAGAAFMVPWIGDTSAGGSGSFYTTTGLTFNPSTGVFSVPNMVNSASALSFGVAASEQMRLTSTGLGIGTSSPDAKLVIANPATGVPTLKLSGFADGTAGIPYAIINFYNEDGSQAGPNNAAAIKALNASSDGSGGQLAFYTALPSASEGSDALERMRLDSSGNLGLGVTPSAYQSGWRGIQILGTGANIKSNGSITIDIASNTTGDFKYAETNLASTYRQTVGQHQWYTAASGTAGNAITFTQAMTLDASGNLLVGTTSNTYGGTGIIQNNSTIISGLATGSGYNNINSAALEGTSGRVIVNHSGTSDGSLYVGFAYNGSGIGSITQSGTTAILYNTTSDQRLKENIVNAPEFGSVIDSIQVRSFDWKADGTHQRAGFVAQELVTIAPEAVHQPTDTEQMMAVDYSKLVPMLVKEIQSLRKRLADAGL